MPLKPKPCPVCGVVFTGNPKRLYCSGACKRKRDYETYHAANAHLRKYPRLDACRVCGARLQGRKRIFCSKKCKQQEISERYAALNQRSLSLSCGTVGALSELLAAAELMRQGYEVFRALSPSCSCDLAVLLEKRLLRVAVRTGHRNIQGRLDAAVNESEVHRHDVLAIVDLTENKVEFRPALRAIGAVR